MTPTMFGRRPAVLPAAGRVRQILLVSALTAVLAACGGGSSGSSPVQPPAPVVTTLSVEGSALSSADSQPVRVSVSLGGQSVQADATGRFILSVPKDGAPQSAKVSAPGYLDQWLPLPGGTQAVKRLSVSMVPAAPFQSIDAGVANTVTAPSGPASVDLPASGLVRADGSVAAGQVNARVTPLDPARSPQTMPGEYRATGGSRIESFGAIKVDLQDSQGQRLNLKAGAKAVIRIPLSTRSADTPATIPLFYFDEQQALWVKEGSATLKKVNGEWVYEGEVSHFTYWNADRYQETVYLNGCVVDEAGAPVKQLGLEADGIDYSGHSASITDDKGEFSIALRKDSLALLHQTGEAERALAEKVGPYSTDTTVRPCYVLKKVAASAPVILAWPQAPVWRWDQPMLLSVQALGVGLRYQWYRNGVAIPGETQAAFYRWLSVSDVGAVFTVKVSNASGSLTSPGLTVNADNREPLLVSQPRDVTVPSGAKASFTVQVLQSSGFKVQWQRNGVDIPGATSLSYEIGPVTPGDSNALFTAVVTNVNGKAISIAARLLVEDSLPTIVQGPSSLVVTVGQTPQFSVRDTGGNTYQWLKNGVAVPFQKGPVLTLDAATLQDNGSLIEVIVSNGFGSVKSAPALLNVLPVDSPADERYELLRTSFHTMVFTEAGLMPVQMVDDNMLIKAKPDVCTTEGTGTIAVDGTLLNPGQKLPLSGTALMQFKGCSNSGERWDGQITTKYSLDTQRLVGSAESNIQGLKYTTGLVTSNYEKQLQVDGGVKVQLNTTGAAGQSTTVLVATPSVGAQLTNLKSGKVMQLQGGSIELRTVSRDSDRNLVSSAFRYNAVQYQLGGMSYVLDGELLFTMGGTPSTSGYSGEVLLRENGVVVGRILGNGMQISVDVQGKIQTLRAPKRYTR